MEIFQCVTDRAARSNRRNNDMENVIYEIVVDSIIHSLSNIKVTVRDKSTVKRNLERAHSIFIPLAIKSDNFKIFLMRDLFIYYAFSFYKFVISLVFHCIIEYRDTFYSFASLYWQFRMSLTILLDDFVFSIHGLLKASAKVFY